MSDDVGAFCDEACAVLRAGLKSADRITVDDTGARHRNRNGVTTRIGAIQPDRGPIGCFLALHFLQDHVFQEPKEFPGAAQFSQGWADDQDYVITAEALAYMRERYLAGAVIEQLDGHVQKVFADETVWSDHLDQLGISQLPHAGSGVHPLNAELSQRSAVKIATEGALFGSIRAYGLLQNTVIVSDGAGQFRLDNHADCWIHAERLAHKLDSFNGGQRRAIEIERELIWWLYRDLKLYKEEPSRQRAAQLRVRVKRIFSRKTGFASLDRLLKRRLERKDDLLRVLDRPEIPLHTNGSENDIRCHITKRKISGGTRSEAGRDASLGLMTSSSV